MEPYRGHLEALLGPIFRLLLGLIKESRLINIEQVGAILKPLGPWGPPLGAIGHWAHLCNGCEAGNARQLFPLGAILVGANCWPPRKPFGSSQAQVQVRLKRRSNEACWWCALIAASRLRLTHRCRSQIAIRRPLPRLPHPIRIHRIQTFSIQIRSVSEVHIGLYAHILYILFCKL